MSSTAHAQYQNNYAKGLAAYKDGNYAEARRLFSQARDEHPEPNVRTRLYGMRFEPYVPQHYLGLIAIQQGDCAGAIAQWSAAGNADVVGQVADLASEEKSAGAKCGALAQTKPTVSTPTAPTNANKPVSTSEPLVPPTVAQKPPVAAPVAPDTEKPTVVASVKPNDAAPVKPPAPIPEKPAVADKAAPPDQLVAAFEKFLSGNLSEVSRINPDAYAEARVRFHAYLVRAGARYTLAQINNDQGLLENARADARAAHALNAGANPDPVLFSPRFLTFYAENR